MSSNISEVTILEEIKGLETGGHFRAEKLEVAVGAAVGDYSAQYSWKTARALLAGGVDVAADWVGDEVTLLVSPDTVIGALTSASAALAVTHNVSQTVVDSIQLGYLVKIGTENLGEVVAIDAQALTITTDDGLVAQAASGSGVEMTVCMARNAPMTAVVSKSIGESKIGASYLPPNTVVEVIYHNLTGGVARTFKMIMEVLY